MANIKIAYEIHKVKGKHTVEERVARFKDGKYAGLEDRKREVNGGFMVYFPRGHSIFLETQEQLALFGLDRPSGQIDMDTGEYVDATPRPTLKDAADKAAQAQLVE